MGRASYQPSHDSLRIGEKPCGRVGRIEASLKALGCSHAWCLAYAKAIAVAYPLCSRVVKVHAIEGRKVFDYRDAEGNLRRGELK